MGLNGTVCLIVLKKKGEGEEANSGVVCLCVVTIRLISCLERLLGRTNSITSS